MSSSRRSTPSVRTTSVANATSAGSIPSTFRYVVSISTSALIRSGTASAMCWATTPPIEWPSSANRSQPSASTSRRASSANVAIE